MANGGRSRHLLARVPRAAVLETLNLMAGARAAVIGTALRRARAIRVGPVRATDVARGIRVRSSTCGSPSCSRALPVVTAAAAVGIAAADRTARLAAEGDIPLAAEVTTNERVQLGKFLLAVGSDS
jgi:hypothetical protein